MTPDQFVCQTCRRPVISLPLICRECYQDAVGTVQDGLGAAEAFLMVVDAFNRPDPRYPFYPGSDYEW